MKSCSMLLTAALLTAVLTAPPAFAAGGGRDGGWQFDLAPFYGWLVSVDGETGIGPVNQSLSADFGDIWSNLEAVVTGHAEARKGC